MADNPSNPSYNHAVQAIKTAILQSQYNAIKLANQEQLALYYGIGRYISENSRNGFWGKGAVAYISNRLQAELPGLRGFSQTNLKMMRIFYEEWNPAEAKSAITTADLQNVDIQIVNDDIVKIDNLLLNRQLQLTKWEDFPLRDYEKPMGVATYKTASDMPERLRKALPDMEELKKIL